MQQRNLLSVNKISSFTVTTLLFGLGFLAIGLGQPLGVAHLPLIFLLKEHFLLSASQVALFSAAITIPFYLKPIAGLFADTSLRKTNHRTQLAWCSAVIIILWGVTFLAKAHLTALFISLLILTIGIVFANTVLGGLLVEFGQQEKATGRISAVRITAEAIGVVISGSLGGFLSSKNFGFSALICAISFLCLLFVTKKIKLVRDSTQTKKLIHDQLKILAQAKDLWCIVFILFLVLVAPGLRTTLLYFQTDSLHFSKQLVGNLSAINGIFALFGTGLYAYYCRKIPIRRLLWFGISMYILTTLFYLLYHSPVSAGVVEALNGFALATAALPVLDLAARSCPKQLEATAFGVILSVTNIALAISDVVGTTLYSHYHVSFYHLVWFSLSTTLFALPFVARIPKHLMSSTDK